MKRYATSIILALTLFIGEIHTFWEKAPPRKENWILDSYQPMTIQWNVKMVAEEIIVVLYFIAMWLFWMYPNRVNKTSVKTFIVLALADLGLYFWNFKTINFHYVYFGLVAVWIILYKSTSVKPLKK